ncbi:MAG: Rieske 2Fe-2S domain-containing protein [Trueperaceae bacterium]
MTATRHDVGAEADFVEDTLTPVTIEGQAVVVAKQGGRVYAVPDRCTHAKFPLSDGELLPGKIKCIHHGATFDLETGRATMPAIKKLRLYDAAVEDGRVIITLQQA